jgi:aquaporin related protein
MLGYETATPNQDVSRPEGDNFNPDDHANNPNISFAPKDTTDADAIKEKGRLHGTPREYGAGRRPYSESPAPPHPNDQFAGLAERGMHADEIIKPPHSLGGGSDRTLASPVGNQVHKSAVKPESLNNSTNGNKNRHRRERSVKNNTYSIRQMSQGLPDDEDFYEKHGV